MAGECVLLGWPFISAEDFKTNWIDRARFGPPFPRCSTGSCMPVSIQIHHQSRFIKDRKISCAVNIQVHSMKRNTNYHVLLTSKFIIKAGPFDEMKHK
jgi:hypothetical protein